LREHVAQGGVALLSLLMVKEILLAQVLDAYGCVRHAVTGGVSEEA
jgi:hypothetical protein